MADLDILNVGGVVQRLTTPSERWGWEFNEPVAVRAFPHPRPGWLEPPVPFLPTQADQYLRARAALPKRVAIAGAILLIGLCAGRYGIVLDLIALGLAGFWFVPMYQAKQRADAMLAEHQHTRQQAMLAHEAGDARWQQDERAWTQAEQQRVAASDRWYPIVPSTVPSRIDVFGGTAEGQAKFLTTLCAGLLGSRTQVTVLDLTEREVGAPVAMVGRIAEFPHRQVRLPADLHQAGLLDGMAAEDVAEVIAEAMHTRRGTHEAGALRDLDADILKNVASRLDGTITFARLVAALRVVQRIEEIGGRDSLLSAQERRRLSDYVDLLGGSERNLAQAQDLRSTLESLAGSGAPADLPDPGPASSVVAEGLTLYVSEDPNNRRRDLLNRLVVQTLVHRLRRREITGGVIAIAGADHLGAEPLQALHRAAQRSAVRLVLLIEHLSEGFESYLGDPESASIFMRMQNAKEAARAAEYIGKGNKFLLTQLSRTEGTSRSTGTTTTTGTSENWSRSTGSSSGAGGHSSNKSSSYSYGESQSTGRTSTDGTNESSGETHSRVYEFEVEPTTFQGLDPASFLLVEPVPGGRRVVAGTCDPAVLTLHGVAERPLGDGERNSAAAPAHAATAMTAAPAVPAPRQAPHEVTITDPTGQFRPFADRLVQAGYLVQYAQSELTGVGGWLITGHVSGRPLNEHEIMSYR